MDLPGYGYAKVSKTMRADWGVMAEEYLAKREELVLSIQLVDSRHKPTTLDRQLHEWLQFHHKNHLIVATKADKLSNNKLNTSLREIEKILPGSKIIAFSSVTGKGKDKIWGEITENIYKSNFLVDLFD